MDSTLSLSTRLSPSIVIRLFESNNDVLKFESRLKEFLMDCRSQSLPIMTRGLPVSPYWTTTDDRLVEAPITRVVYDQQSDHQHIMVLDTTDFGKLLVLDDQANLGESDLVYTTTLMGGGAEDYKDKQVFELSAEENIVQIGKYFSDFIIYLNRYIDISCRCLYLEVEMGLYYVSF